MFCLELSGVVNASSSCKIQFMAARVEDPGSEVGPLILDVVSLGGFKLHSALIGSFPSANRTYFLVSTCMKFRLVVGCIGIYPF